MTPRGLLLSDDLIFNSRILGTAKDLVLEFRAVRDSARLVKDLQNEPATCVILDLANHGLDVALLLQQLKSLPSPPRVVAYGSHVDAAGLKAAREAGCDLVLPRSAFVERLAAELAGWMVDGNCNPEPKDSLAASFGSNSDIWVVSQFENEKRSN